MTLNGKVLSEEVKQLKEERKSINVKPKVLEEDDIEEMEGGENDWVDGVLIEMFERVIESFAEDEDEESIVEENNDQIKI